MPYWYGLYGPKLVMDTLRPNIIFIAASQMRWDSLGCMGNEDIHTPNLDALAAHGVRFSQARSGNFTDLRTTLLNQFKVAGYHVQQLGRLAGEADEDGYEDWLGAQEGAGHVQSTHPTGTLFLQSCGAVRSNLPGDLAHSHWVGTEAVRFLSHPPEPFFLSVNFQKPAWPFDPGAPWDEQYDPNEISLPASYHEAQGQILDGVVVTEGRLRKALAFYYGLVSQLDEQVGRMLSTLTARGRTNNLFVFTSDRGAAMGEEGVLYDPEAESDMIRRVPLIFAGMGCERKGAVEEQEVSHEALAPTFAALLDPADAGGMGPGFSGCLRHQD